MKAPTHPDRRKRITYNVSETTPFGDRNDVTASGFVEAINKVLGTTGSKGVHTYEGKWETAQGDKKFVYFKITGTGSRWRVAKGKVVENGKMRYYGLSRGGPDSNIWDPVLSLPDIATLDGVPKASRQEWDALLDDFKKHFMKLSDSPSPPIAQPPTGSPDPDQDPDQGPAILPPLRPMRPSGRPQTSKTLRLSLVSKNKPYASSFFEKNPTSQIVFYLDFKDKLLSSLGKPRRARVMLATGMLVKGQGEGRLKHNICGGVGGEYMFFGGIGQVFPVWQRQFTYSLHDNVDPSRAIPHERSHSMVVLVIEIGAAYQKDAKEVSILHARRSLKRPVTRFASLAEKLDDPATPRKRWHLMDHFPITLTENHKWTKI
ncbi:hypothetical protein BDP27DRAFT_1359673 [Rhodocollybia butyracea]|uniref:Uncharacterized protein n=1 Tax=Rhodocollybia butyracea TaxID=206335 RepID=A0A9P5Q4K7_9AGAR|nr:hypothetical protein BDP27DRAFT_1359673 [Rhodocollybia butyracea]